MFYDLPLEIRIIIGFGLIVLVAIYLLCLVVWCIIKHMIIHHRKRICKHEQSCTLCDKGYCTKCDGHKEVVRPERVENDTPCRNVEDRCIIVCEKNGEGK